MDPLGNVRVCTFSRFKGGWAYLRGGEYFSAARLVFALDCTSERTEATGSIRANPRIVETNPGQFPYNILRVGNIFLNVLLRVCLCVFVCVGVC